MKKYIFLAASLILCYTSAIAQDRSMPKSGPAPTVNIGKPTSFTLKNGLKVLVVENKKLPRVSYNLTIDAAPYTEGAKKGVSDLVSDMLGNGTKKISKEAFNEETDFLGANIAFSSSGAYASGLSKYSDRVLELMADGALNPVFTQQELDDSRNRMIEALKSNEKSVSAIAARVENVLAYGINHPSGEFTSEETLKNVSLEDVKLNYNTYFVPGNAYLVIIGDVDAKKIKKQVERNFSSWKKALAPNVSFTEPTNVQYSQINFINVPHAVQSEISVVNTVNLKMTDKEFFAGVLANQILGGGGEGRLFLNLREAHGWTYGSYSSLGVGKYTRKFRASASVRNMVTDSAVVEILNEVKKMRTDLVSAEDLKNAKAKYIGNFVMETQKPGTIARYALNTETNKLPADFYENYIKNLNAVTAQDIKNVANKYFMLDNFRIVIAGKAQDVLPNLEKTAKQHKLPIFYFDNFGNKVEKPEVNRVIPADVTVNTVITDYLNAIGGEKKLAAIKSLMTVSSGTIQGTPVEAIAKATNDGKISSEMKAMGQTMMKQVFDGSKGKISQQGQSMDMPEDMIKELKGKAIFEELNLVKSGAKLATLETLDNKDVYTVTLGSKTYYFDVASKLKVAVKTEVEQMGQKMSQTTTFADYKEVKGIKVPHETDIELAPGMSLKLMTTQVKINEGVNANDFKL